PQMTLPLRYIENGGVTLDIRHGGAATTVTSLNAGQGSGNIDKTPSMPPMIHLSQEFTHLEVIRAECNTMN
ncbi:hypothetical protein Tco_0284371, partial [Tanacetum coccineum]